MSLVTNRVIFNRTSIVGVGSEVSSNGMIVQNHLDYLLYAALLSTLAVSNAS